MTPSAGRQPFAEDDLLPISALQHLLFCERQCALIHVEGLWAENRLTVEGRHLHRNAHEARPEAKAGIQITRSLTLRSFRLGLIGKSDVVEFRGSENVPFPVEYKRGKPKKHDADRVQLCAQALCLEEMLAKPVPIGALYYGTTHRRTEVAFDEALRRLTEDASERLHQLVASGKTPIATLEPKCATCSLIELCMPAAMDPGRTAGAYLSSVLAANLAEAPPPP